MEKWKIWVIGILSVAVVIFVLSITHKPTNIAIRGIISYISNIEIRDKQEMEALKLLLDETLQQRKEAYSEILILKKDREELTTIVENQNSLITGLYSERDDYKNQLKEVLDSQTNLAPTEQTALFDELTGEGETSQLLEIEERLRVQTPLERISTSNQKMIVGKFYEEETARLCVIIEELHNTITPLQSIIKGLEQENIEKDKVISSLMKERDTYKSLYEKEKSSTALGTAIAWGIVALETVIIILILL